jgi:hypothetical protein
MRTVQAGVTPDACKPLAQQTRILSGRLVSISATAAASGAGAVEFVGALPIVTMTHRQSQGEAHDLDD